MNLRLLIGFPYVIALFLISIFNYANPYLIIAVYASYILHLFFISKRFLMIYSYIIFYITTNILGVFLIESNSIYLNELMMNSMDYHSLSLLTIAQIIFIEVIRVMYLRKGVTEESNMQFDSFVQLGKLKLNKIYLIKLFLVAVCLVFCFLYLRVINKPFFVVKLDRFLYQDQYLPGLINTISNSFIYISPLVAIYAYFTKDKKVYLLLMIAFLYFFWIGHKFSYFINIGYLVAMPFIVFGSYKILKKFFKIGIVSLILLMLIVSIQSLLVFDRDASENVEYFKSRLAQQGQLWWATYGLVSKEKNHIDELEDEYKTYYKGSLTKDETYNSGIYKIMQLTTPYDVFIRKVEDKESRYAYSTQATIYYYFKGLGLIIFSVLSAVLYFIITNSLIKNLVRGNIIVSILLARLFVIYNRVLMQSDFNKLFSWEVILILYGLVICLLVHKINKKEMKLFTYSFPKKATD